MPRDVRLAVGSRPVSPRSLRRACACAVVVLLSCRVTAQQVPFAEHVDVARVLIDARVVDDGGRPIPDLQPSDFAVKIDGRTVRVESAEWVSGQSPNESRPPGDETPALTRSASVTGPSVPRARDVGRLVVFLVQKDLEPSRIGGLMQVAPLVDRLLRPLTRDDRMAVLSFDSRLHLWSDFTNDLERVRSMLATDVIVRRPGPITASADVSLFPALEPAVAARTSAIEKALEHIAAALEPLPGAKALVLLGYGFGRYNGRTGDVLLMDGYDEASAALQRARVAVFTLNITQANYNSLQAGLETVAADTGGIYASTYEFPAVAIRRVSDALAGYYVLFVEKPDLGRGMHHIKVRLTGRRGTVLARSSYVDSR